MKYAECPECYAEVSIDDGPEVDHLQTTLATLRADLARVTEERDAAQIFAQTRGPMCQCSDDESCRMMREMHVARRERDEARAKVEGLTLSERTVVLAVALLEGRRDIRARNGRNAPRTIEAIAELTRYAEALGVRS